MVSELRSEKLQNIPWYVRLELARKTFHVVPGLPFFLARNGFSTSPLTWFFVGAIFYGLLKSVSADAAVGTYLIGFFALVLLDVFRFLFPAFNQFVFWLLGSMWRQREFNRLNGSVFYTAGILLTWSLYDRHVAMLSILYLAFCDPTASFFGVLFGRHTYQFRNGKSLAGSLAALLMGIVVTLVYCSMEGSCTSRFGLDVRVLALYGGLSAALTELVTIRWLDDNLVLPVCCGFLLSLFSS